MLLYALSTPAWDSLLPPECPRRRPRVYSCLRLLTRIAWRQNFQSADEDPWSECTPHCLRLIFVTRRRAHRLPRSRYAPSHIPTSADTQTVPRHSTAVGPCVRYTLRRDDFVPHMWWCKSAEVPLLKRGFMLAERMGGLKSLAELPALVIHASVLLRGWCA